MKKVEAFQKLLDVYKELKDQAIKFGVPIDIFKAMFMAGLSSKFGYSFEEVEKTVEVLENFISEKEEGNIN